MSRFMARLALVLAAWTPAHTQTARPWTLASNDHFEVYSQAGEESARRNLTWFERLRALLIRELGARPDRVRPARVFGFASAAEYAPYRLTASAEAFYVGTEGRDYIVMAVDGPRALGIAAHEYAHMALHSSGIEVPRWLSEGLAEVFSTLRIDGRGGVLGGDRPEHSDALRRTSWLPLSELLRLREPPSAPGIFYAESWALADMLALSPEYSGRLRPLLGALAAMPPEAAFASVYARTLDQVAAGLRAWLARRRSVPPYRLAGVSGENAAIVSVLDDQRSRTLLAQMLLDAGDTDRAESRFRELLAESPQNGDAQAALGLIALRRGNPGEARERWSRALELDVTDDALCFRYAVLAPQAGLPEAAVRPVLERAVAIRPDFDDARYSLALIEKNAGRFEAALDHLRAMRGPGPARAFAYWSAISDTLNSLDRHEEAEAAANTAAAHASSAAERARAAELAHVAQTEIAVQLARNPDGSPRMVTTRVPRRATNWNPFVEPLDDARTVEGALVEIDCAGPMTRIVVESGGTRQRLAIPDPARVQMRNAPAEFTCGPQSGEKVSVTYAASRGAGEDGIVRGIEFR